jgi:hypothetical protein
LCIAGSAAARGRTFSLTKPVPAVPRVAFLGNSYFYFNDTPRLLQELHGGEHALFTADCLRGGSSWRSLLVDGDGMEARSEWNRFPWNGKPTVEALLRDPYDFVVCVDYSQNNARGDHKAETTAALDKIVSMAKAGGSKTIVLMPSAAYLAPAKGSEAIGSWADFYYKQGAGYREHLRYLLAAGVDAKIADANEAYKVVKEEDPALWQLLFHTDNFHPTVFGTFLQACIIHATIFGQAPAESALPPDPKVLWARARRLLPRNKDPAQWPTRDQLLYLREVAARVAAMQ